MMVMQWPFARQMTDRIVLSSRLLMSGTGLPFPPGVVTIDGTERFDVFWLVIFLRVVRVV